MSEEWGLFGALARRALLRWTAGILAGLGAGGASAEFFQPVPALGSPVRVLEQGARPTAAFAAFCQRLPNECRVDLAEPETVTLTSAAWRRIVEVNRDVNEAIEAVTDREHWGVEDRWDYPDDGRGDCEDIQLLKRRKLVESGLPRRALLMTVVLNAAGEGHAVLLVRTDRGDLVLDNQNPRVLPWHETGLVFLKREGQEGAGWVALTSEPATIRMAGP